MYQITHPKFYFHTILNHYFCWLLSIFYTRYSTPTLDCTLKREKRHMEFYHKEPCTDLKDVDKIMIFFPEFMLKNSIKKI